MFRNQRRMGLKRHHESIRTKYSRISELTYWHETLRSQIVRKSWMRVKSVRTSFVMRRTRRYRGFTSHAWSSCKLRHRFRLRFIGPALVCSFSVSILCFVLIKRRNFEIFGGKSVYVDVLFFYATRIFSLMEGCWVVFKWTVVSRLRWQKFKSTEFLINYCAVL